MPQEMIGRRVAIQPKQQPESALQNPGDYCGPIVGFNAALPAVFFLLPNSRDEGTLPEGRSIHYVISPPHRFIEETDGSLTIRESIGAQPHWHGYLTCGKWELNKSKP